MFKDTSDNMFPGGDLRPEKDPVEIGLMGLGVLVLVCVVALQISFSAKPIDDTDFTKTAQAQKSVKQIETDTNREIIVVLESEDSPLHNLFIYCEKLELELKKSVTDETVTAKLHKLAQKKLCDTISQISESTGIGAGMIAPHH